MIYILNGMIGIVLLALGRRLFWLFVGCVDFVAQATPLNEVAHSMRGN